MRYFFRRKEGNRNISRLLAPSSSGTTAGEFVEFSGAGSSANIDATSSWEESAFRLGDAAAISNHGELLFKSLEIASNASLGNYGNVTIDAGALSLREGSHITYAVSNGPANGTLTSTTIDLTNNAAFSLEEGSLFTLDFTQGAPILPGYHEVTLTLVTGILAEDAAKITETLLSSLQDNTSVEFGPNVQAIGETEFEYSINNGTLLLNMSFTAVPEPATAALSLLALAALAARRRRRL